MARGLSADALLASVPTAMIRVPLAFTALAEKIAFSTSMNRVIAVWVCPMPVGP
jgi:hypothetical protein